MLTSISAFLANHLKQFHYFDQFAALLFPKKEWQASYPYPGFYNAQHLQPARIFVKMCAATILFSGLQLSAGAQCKTFINADEANPLISVLPAGSTLVGFDFTDIDADGDLDAYVILKDGSPLLYLNTGTTNRPGIYK